MVLAVQAAVPPPYTVQVTRGKVKPRSKGGASDGLQAAASERLAAALLNDSQWDWHWDMTPMSCSALRLFSSFCLYRYLDGHFTAISLVLLPPVLSAGHILAITQRPCECEWVLRILSPTLVLIVTVHSLVRAWLMGKSKHNKKVAQHKRKSVERLCPGTPVQDAEERRGGFTFAGPAQFIKNTRPQGTSTGPDRKLTAPQLWLISFPYSCDTPISFFWAGFGTGGCIGLILWVRGGYSTLTRNTEQYSYSRNQAQ